MSSFSSTRHFGNFKVAVKHSRENTKMAEEKAFSSVLIDTVCEAVGNALGHNVLQILVSKGLLDNSNNSQEFHEQLQSLFGNGAVVLERLVVKDLFRKLSIPYNSQASFDYRESLETAKEVCYLEARLK